jgi:hypothetical protein
MEKERKDSIKKLLVEGKNLVDIRIAVGTSSKVIQELIDEYGLREYRKELKNKFRSDVTARMNTPEALEKRAQTYLKKKEEVKLLGTRANRQKALDDKVKALNYKSCSDYIQKNGARSFRKNILQK